VGERWFDLGLWNLEGLWCDYPFIICWEDFFYLFIYIVCFIFQCALLYTTVYGQRRIRVANLSLPCTNNLSNLFRLADLDSQFVCFLKQGIEFSVMHSLCCPFFYTVFIVILCTHYGLPWSLYHSHPTYQVTRIIITVTFLHLHPTSCRKLIWHVFLSNFGLSAV